MCFYQLRCKDKLFFNNLVLFFGKIPTFGYSEESEVSEFFGIIGVVGVFRVIRVVGDKDEYVRAI
jgi:hypothetical protein